MTWNFCQKWVALGRELSLMQLQIRGLKKEGLRDLFLSRTLSVFDLTYVR